MFGSRPVVTVVVPTRNRCDLLASTLTAVLAQDVADMAVEVHDNASEDDTESVVAGVADERVVYRRHRTGIGLFRNWSQALDGVASPFVALVADDDVLAPGFLRRAVEALSESPSASLAFSDAELIDDRGRTVGSRSSGLPIGRFSGLEYLDRVVAGENVIVDMSASVLRTEAVRAVGGLDVTHQTHDIVFNLQFRLAAGGDLVRLADGLVKVRQHAAQAHRDENRAGGAIGMVSERMDAAAMLLRTARADDPEYRRWLADRLLWLSRLRSQYTADALPTQTSPAGERLKMAARDICAALPFGSTVALAGDDLTADDLTADDLTSDPAGPAGLVVCGLTDVDGSRGGPPEDGIAAVDRIERLRADGVRYVAFPWPTFWWLDYYRALRDRLAVHAVVVDNSRVVVFDLASEATP